MAVFTTDRALIQRETTPGGGSYTTIPQATNIKLPEWVRKSVEVYIHDQAAPVVKTGGSEPMECSFDLAWDPGNATYHQALFSDFTAKTERSYQVVLPDTGAAQFRFNAIVSGLSAGDLDAEGSNPLLLTVTLKLSAEPTITW
jgi:hypothetical protein